LIALNFIAYFCLKIAVNQKEIFVLGMKVEPVRVTHIIFQVYQFVPLHLSNASCKKNTVLQEQ